MVKISNLRRRAALSRSFTNFFLGQAKWSKPAVEALRSLRKRCAERPFEAFLFGGVPRTLWLFGPRHRVRDFDIVVEDSAFDEFKYSVRDSIVRENRFGGLKLGMRGVDIDVWPLSSTWAFANGSISPPSFENLPKTTFLNVDSIVVELAPRRGRPRRIFQDQFFSSVRRQLLDINLEENPFPELCAIRALKISRALGFDISLRLGLYIDEVISHSSDSRLLNAQITHYGRVSLDSDDLLSIAARIKTQLVDGDRNEISLFPKTRRQTELWELDNYVITSMNRKHLK